MPKGKSKAKAKKQRKSKRIGLVAGLICLIVIVVVAIVLVLIFTFKQKPQAPLPATPFCGISTEGKCNSNADCIVSGCSGQVCQSKQEARMITTCEWRDCYNASMYGLSCKCVSNKCKWS
jgi:eight-cysteine-cluster-containing protein